MDYRLTLQLTRSCNLSCDYCYEKNRDPAVMSGEIAQACIDRAFSRLKAGDFLHLHYFGGEPFMVFDRCREIQALAEDASQRAGVGLKAFVVTNGTLLNEKSFSWIRDHLIHLIVSLDGIEPAQGLHRRFPDGTNSFPAVWSFLSGLSPKDLANIHLNLVLTPANLRYLPESLETFIRNGFRHISVSPDYYAAWNSASREKLTELMEVVQTIYIDHLSHQTEVFLSFVEEKIRRILNPGEFARVACTFGRNEIAYDPLGNAFPCERMINSGVSGGYCLGSVREENPRKSGVARVRRQPTRCSACSNRELCTHFCGCVNYARTGDVDQPDELVCFFETLFITTARRITNRFFSEREGACTRAS